MNKKELIQAASVDSGLPQATTEKVLDSILQVLIVSMQREERITLTGIGRFEVQQRSARKGYNPNTGVKIDIPAKKMVRFKPGKLLIISPK